MTSTIDDLLARASVPTSDPRTFDVAGALCRLAADTSRVSSPPQTRRATQAGQMLAVVSRWAINEPDAAAHMSEVVEDPGTGELLTVERLDADGAADGAMVFACLLYLTGHPESAQFWWQFAAGAESRTAAYCLHLHHRHLQEFREARQWYQQVTAPAAPHSQPLDEEFIDGLEAVARYVRHHGSGASAPTGGLESEVDRLASRNCSPSPAIVRWPDRRLAERLRQFTARRR
ncbi:hypothetical protein OG949_41040 (plasmid) [Streptomyces scopuliridis]|uniref:hypothetical protein n=1 Tax=Streptomyces scopuliridis TaxID=452529 RepID=UPI002DD7E308|nr:hypothetical protein [Streptomyces scopuliridis]WSB39129.1 hypothetical protein OG949_41040 [Streptomyces scopuliridis]